MNVMNITHYESICPDCQKTSEKKIKVVKTCMSFIILEDENGKEHDHDKNLMQATFYCEGCKKEFYCRAYITCWCGWDSRFPYEKEVKAKFIENIGFKFAGGTKLYNEENISIIVKNENYLNKK